MKLVPFILRKKTINKLTVFSVNVFLSHAGKSVWKTEEPGLLSKESILGEYCEPNGLIVSDVCLDTVSKTAYLQINPELTRLSDFYTSEEASGMSSKPECWRRFYFFKDNDGCSWWSPQGLIEAEIQDYGNVEHLFLRIQELFETPKKQLQI